MLDTMLGILAITGGFILIFFSLGEILLRLCVALCGLWLINYGFKLQGKGSLYNRAYSWFVYRKF